MGYQRHIPQGIPCRLCGKGIAAHRIAHNPDGDPCKRCHYPARYHRAKHKPKGDPCEQCGQAASAHEARTPSERRNRKTPTYYVGVDGEGQGRIVHRYTLLAASDENGKRKWYVENEKGLSTRECLEFLIRLPAAAKSFAYAFNYDLTKILADLSNEQLYLLFRPELRQRPGEERKKGPRPIRWNGFTLNLQSTKFTVGYGSRKRIIWDVFKFYQASFVDALRLWKVGLETVDEIERLKDQRADFDKLDRESIRQYCFNECSSLATLVRRLVEAHTAAGLNLHTFYGAGSTSSCILKSMGIGTRRVDPIEEMREPVASAFFGGRFEHSVIGPVQGPVYSYDISSAYPYQTTFLPCLVHAEWQSTTQESDLLSARHALVRYSLDRTHSDAWAPFPFRESDGTISFPRQSGGGWVWRDEYAEGKRLFGGAVRFEEAWLLIGHCDCQPFADIPKYYLERLRIGKEGPGIVIKLGVNGCYGKLAQSVGINPPYQSWIWAGMITSGCRAQILRIMGRLSSFDALLAVATDGIYTTEPVTPPLPADTGTGHTDKPLGGWEAKIVDEGVFFARPGIYFPLNPSDADLKDIRGRGIGKKTMLAHWRRIVEAYDKGLSEARMPDVTRFCGAKTSISRADGGAVYNRAKTYGQWVTREVKLSLEAQPKRAAIDGNRLTLREFEPTLSSTPYNRAAISQEALELRMATIEASEQPDGVDFTDYE